MPTVESHAEWMTLKDVMYALELGHTSVYRLVLAGKLERREPGPTVGFRRYSRASVERVKAEMQAIP